MGAAKDLVAIILMLVIFMVAANYFGFDLSAILHAIHVFIYGS